VASRAGGGREKTCKEEVVLCGNLASLAIEKTPRVRVIIKRSRTAFVVLTERVIL